MSGSGWNVSRGRIFIRPSGRAARLFWLFFCFFSAFQLFGCIGPTAAANSSVFLPRLFDPYNRPDAPANGAVKEIRFLTADDYPPFEFMGPDGTLAGFNVDLARAICAELKASCTIQPRRWDNLLDAMKAKAGDAVIASIRETPAAQARLRFTDVLLPDPGALHVARLRRNARCPAGSPAQHDRSGSRPAAPMKPF